MIVPLLFIAGGAAALYAIFSRPDERDVPVFELPDIPAVPSPPPPESAPSLPSTRYRRVDAILGGLQRAAQSSGIPLGLIVGWIIRESAGKIGEIPKVILKGESDYERGLFQLTPSESRALGFTDHKRLSTDLNYSISAGIALINKYTGDTERLGVAPKGTSYFWRVVKLIHTMGLGATKKIVELARAAGQAGTWDSLERFALANENTIMSAVHHSPTKWLPMVDQVYALGQPYGFGDAPSIVGGEFDDIVDPLDVIV